MSVIQTRLQVAEDGSITGHVSEGLPAGEHDAEIIVEPVSRAEPALTQPVRWDELDALLDEVARMPILDHRSADEIIGYNENGTFD